MEWLVESMTTSVFLLVKPLLLIKRSFSFCVRSICISVLTFFELLRNAFCLHLRIFRNLTTSVIAVLFLPFRVLNALQNEKLLEMHLREIQRELENVIWDKKRVEKQLHVAIEERKMMVAMLKELEDEHDEAIGKIEQLEDELLGLKEENRQLKETRGKARNSQNQSHTDNETKILSRRTSRATTKTASTSASPRAKESQAPKRSYPDTTDDVRDQARETAISRSIFSAFLSIVVGATVWAAEDPCVPLVVALFVVVVMSLKSVVEYFSAIENNRSYSEAVALLSFNWFVLGALSYPMLPKVAHVLFPLAQTTSDRTLRFLWNLLA